MNKFTNDSIQAFGGTTKQLKSEEKLTMSDAHTLRVRKKRWDAIEKKAWELSNKEQKVIKPTDIADAILWKGIGEITMDDIENAKNDR